jgi:ABC-type glycerol-3-phosphate transport system permease component
VARFLRRIPLYVLLIIGSVVFSFPFVWLAATSVKVDRELFTGDLRIKPLTPSPRAASPYIDTEYFAELSGTAERQADVLPLLEKLARQTGYELPGDIDADLAWQQIARGLYRKLAQALPTSVWAGHLDGPSGLTAGAQAAVTAQMVGEMFGNIDRRLTFGGIWVRGRDGVDHELLADRPAAQRLENLTPQVATLVDRLDGDRQVADVRYDFGAGDRIILAQTLTLPFAATDLQRVQVQWHPDDTWHGLQVLLSVGDKTYTGQRSIPLANFDWQTLTWQWPSADDYSTKIRTWTVLHPASQEDARAPGAALGPQRVRLTLVITRAGPVAAWWHKLRLNYDRVLDQIPFWRYLRVSVFLVIANIILTVLFSSLVAYSFARLNWPGREFCFVLLLASMMIPGQVTMIPQFLIWKSMGAYNTLAPLCVAAAFGNAFFIFLLRQFMKGIPRDLEDAARIDGCGFLRIYWHVVLPLVKPSLAAIAIFTFMGTWNDFMGPLLYVADQRLYPLAFGLYAFSVQVSNNPTLTMAGSLLMTLPVIAIFFLAQKYFIQGVTLTGMKA